MKFYILTLFPEMMKQVLSESILGRAQENHLIEIQYINIRDFSNDKHHSVDDYPYGGGAGMVMQAQPIYDAYLYAIQAIGHQAPCIYLTPQGNTFSQKMAEEFAVEDDLIFLCGHYEGIDERVIEEIVTHEVSIGDYVLTGGELPALVMMDAISRLIPGVLHNQDSAVTESFGDGLLEYPQYSRPSIWHSREVPPVLLSGNHAIVDDWRFQQAQQRTQEKRPDMWEQYQRKNK